MSNIKIIPSSLKGEIAIPSSKSMGHREIICASLAKGKSIVDNVSISKDIEATCNGLRAMGAKIKEIKSQIDGRVAFEIEGVDGKVSVNDKSVDCNESGSTLRFLIPLACLSEEEVIFQGRGMLVSRPLDVYFDIFNEQNLEYTILGEEGNNLPLSVKGKLKSGHYKMLGNVSSQFISGLLFALPLLEEDSVIEITSELESQSYIAMTLSCLEKYGIVIEHDNYMEYRIKGNQQYKSRNSQVEGDYSQIAFWLVAGMLGEEITCTGMNEESLQGDKVVIDIINRMGGNLKVETSTVVAKESKTKNTLIDAKDCPDIIPVLTVLAALSEGETTVINAGRLKIKECDRLHAITTELNKLGADVTELEEGLIIKGKKELTGGVVDSWNDHRIAMSMGVASIKCNSPLIVQGAESIKKSYPEFWNDFTKVGGKIERMEDNE